MQILIQYVWGGARDPAILTNSQVMMMLTVRRPHFVYQGSRVQYFLRAPLQFESTCQHRYCNIFKQC